MIISDVKTVSCRQVLWHLPFSFFVILCINATPMVKEVDLLLLSDYSFIYIVMRS